MRTGIMFFADAHGDFSPLIQAAALEQPAHIVLLGDQCLGQPLHEELASLVAESISIHWIAGNHDARCPATHDHLHGAPGGLHGRAAWMSGCRVAGLGGHYHGRVWYPRQGCERPAWATRAEHLEHLGRGGRYQGGLPLARRMAIYPEDHEAVLAYHSADILVSHEAPTSMGERGFGGLDDMAADLGAGLLVHGHHHHSYIGRTRDGILVRGLGRREAWMLR